MPIVIYKGKRFLIYWKQEWDDIILSVSKRYMVSNRVDWKSAVANGEFDSLPVNLIRNYTLSKRLTHLKRKDNPEFRAKRLSYYYRHREKIRKQRREAEDNRAKKLVAFRGASQDLKDTYGYRSRQIWTSKQKMALINLTQKYRRGKFIDWNGVLADPKSDVFPYRELKRIRGYFHSIRISRKSLRKKRQKALEYKKKNYSQYRTNQKKNAKIIIGVSNKFLMEKFIERN